MRNLLVVLLLLSTPAFGQTQSIRRQLKAIETQVRAIGKDTLRRVDFSQAMQSPDTVREPRGSLYARSYAAYYNGSRTLQQLVVTQQQEFSSSYTRYYFVQNEVVYIDTDYINASRMGSCGQIRFHNRYFLRHQQVLATQLSEPPTRWCPPRSWRACCKR